ncbi:MAG: hypothetical protein E7011_03290 [Alphaproteobacteria bacterium]|nr:hypothetical protein [Alphaproteobacteria bacterium]
MKKVITTLICFLLTFSANAADVLLKLNSETLGASISSHFSAEDAVNVAIRVRDLLEKSPDGISAVDMWSVCTAGGIKIEENSGKARCQAFLQSLVTFSDKNYVRVCNANEFKKILDTNIRDISKCEREFFNKTNVQLVQAVELAKMYARVKWNDDGVVCSNTYNQAENDDWLSCKSLKTGAFYEFKFDDVKESIDNRIQDDVRDSVCRLYDGSWSAGDYCASVTPETCDKISDGSKTLGVQVEWKSDKCYLLFHQISDFSEIKQGCGIDPLTFCRKRDLQLQSNLGLYDLLQQHVSDKCGTPMHDVRCDATFKTFRGTSGGCNLGIFAQKDDIISCYAGNQQIDFLIDDVNEWSDSRAQAGQQGVMCITENGTFDGKNCVALNEQACTALQQENATVCPECKEVEWDPGLGLCVLKSARAMTRIDKAVEFTTAAGVVVAGVAVGVLTGGAAAPGVWAIVAKTGSVLLYAGGAAVVGSEAVMTYGIWDPFVKAANKCILENDAKCAEDLVVRELNSMQSYSEDLTDNEAAALDETFKHLIQMIPEDSEFWTDFFGNPEFFDCTVPTDPQTCVVKESAQFWQVARTAGNTMMIAGGALKMLSNMGTIFKQSRELLRLRVEAMPRHKNIGVLAQVNAWGTRGISMPNRIIPEVAAKLGLNNVTTNSELVKAMGWKVGQELMWNPTTQTIVQGAAMNPYGLVPIGIGTGGLIMVPDDTDFIVQRSWAQESNEIPEPEVILDDIVIDDTIEPLPTDIVFDDTVIVVPPRKVPTVKPGADEIPEPEVILDDIIIDDTIEPVPNNSDFNSDQIYVSPIPVSADAGRNVQPYSVERSGGRGWIAAATVAGLVGTGVLVGTLVGKDRNDSNKSNTNTSGNSALESLMVVAGGVLGYVDNNEITLIPLPTVLNTYAPIVDINNRAVVVVLYRGYNLPYYLDASAGTWVPLLGIGANGGWFNTYPQTPTTGISKLDDITQLLNRMLMPRTVSPYVGQNASGVQFPSASTLAYSTINAMFPLGVVTSYNGTFSPSDQKLYDNNYQKMRNLFN